MKLRQPERFSSFYESFSDLIFGTMAIFVLLMMVFLVLVNEGDIKKRKELEEQLAKSQEASQEAQEQLKKVIAEFAELENAVRTKGLELVIAVDRTGSMGLGLKDLTKTLNTFSSAITEYVPEYRVSVLAYHENPAMFIAKRMEVFAKKKDNGQSQSELGDFLNSISPEGGAAPVADAIARAIQQQQPTFQGVQIIMLIGDVGPFEMETSFSNSENANTVLTQMANWVGRSKTRKIVAVYAKKGCELENNCSFPVESLDFFQRACRISGESNDCINPSSEQMLIPLLKAIVVEH